MNKIRVKIVSLLFAAACFWHATVALGASGGVEAHARDPAFGEHPIDPEYLQELVRNGYIPTRAPLSDLELAQKLDLDLPQLAPVKAAVGKGDATVLQMALGAYLNSRLAPARVTATGKPAPNAAAADPWLGSEITFPNPGVDRPPRSYPLGKQMNWWLGCKGCESCRIADWYFAPPLAEAYTANGDARYAERLLAFARDFYPTAGRPPAQRPVTWQGCGGPWRSGGIFHRVGYMAVAYRAIGASPLVTDGDRVMFLKMFWEHCDALYQLIDRPMVQNFAGGFLGLVDTAALFPEFRDQPKWLERSNTFFGHMAQGMVSDDGGPLERSGYGYGVILGLKRGYTKLQGAGANPPAVIRQRLEKAFEYLIFMPTPTWLCPMFGHGTPISLQGHMAQGVEMFPEREDFAYVVSGGQKGSAPARSARDFWNTGLAMMRSDWSTNALYMALNYNGCPWGADQHPEFLSFTLQANGRLYLTNPGTTKDYGSPEEANWDEQTVAANTITVDHESQKTMDNGGRMEIWENLPGFDYLAAVSRGYEWLGVRHRRAMLFMKPLAEPGPKHGYWIVYDRLDSDGRPHEYRWTGHFQPADLKVDAFTKAVETSADSNGNRLYLKSAEPYGHFGFEQGSGPLQAVDGKGGNIRSMGPYISLVRSSADPVAFKVLLYPATKDDQAPLIEPLPARAGEQPTPSMPHQEACSPRHTEEAVGFRVTQGKREDYLAITTLPALRTYGRWGGDLLTDGEVAILRRDDGNLLEAAMVRGQRLVWQGKTLIEASPAIVAVHVRYVGDKAEITTRGLGKLAVSKQTAKQATLNDKPVTVTEANGLWHITAPAAPALALTATVFSTDAKALCKATGVPYGADYGPNDWGYYSRGPANSVLVKWETSSPSDAEVEHRDRRSKTWKRSVCGELRTQHQFVISEIEPGQEYEFRITCRSEEGALATATTTYRAKQKK
ncbi:MAG: heparinase II/III family protein [Verrucomicrobia bacterium]|nr:heparinase II/III family protein [Verrucomicrobiota bacterium]